MVSLVARPVGGGRAGFRVRELVEKALYGHAGDITYSGGWAHGMRHGRGRQVEADGRVYDGEWHRGQKEGEATEVDPKTGEKYEGEYLAGRRHGHGKVTRPGGWSFEGTLSRDCSAAKGR